MKNFLLWTIAIALSLACMVYQRLTGPTHPERGTVKIEQTPVKYKLLRSHDVEIDAPISILVEDQAISGSLIYKRYNSHDEWTKMPLKRDGSKLIAAIPHQPAAGKVVYKVELEKNGQLYPLTKEPVIIRFKGIVPTGILLPHVLFMVLAMILSTRAGLEALAYRKQSYFYALLACCTLLLGGLILGPIVQKYAFGAFWTGWPFGTDLTDNKTALSFIVWIIALIKVKKDSANRFWPIFAAILLLAIYLIPHSMFGSELDYTAQLANP